MRLKITPLNILSALGLMLAALLLFNHKTIVAPVNQAYIGLMIAVCLLTVFISFLGDQIFRKFVPSLLRIWILELSLIAFAVIVSIVLKISFVP